MGFSIVGRKFTPDEFDAYVAGFKPQPWVKLIVLHNTATPSLSQRQGGILTEEHIDNLHTYYQDTQHWSGGPHLFVDATGIWVFNPLTSRGVHSPSYNSSSWGVEMLGNYETESFTTGLGGQVRANALRAVAALARLQKWTDLREQRLILHKEDPETTHICPGKNVNKFSFVEGASALIGGKVDKPLQLIVDGKKIETTLITQNGTVFCPARALAEALDATVDFDAKTNTVTIKK